MSSFARSTDSISHKIIPIARSFSNFEFIQSKYDGLVTLRRIMSQVRTHGARTMVLEVLGETDDTREEDEDLRKIFPDARSELTRLSFFTKGFRNVRGLRSATPEELIGYAIVKKDFLSHEKTSQRIYESIVKTSRHENNYVHGAPSWTCMIRGNEFPLEGYPYAQQNGMTNCCAHVAVRTAAAVFHPDGDMSYREMNDALGVDHVKRKLFKPDGKGLENRELRQLLERAGARCCVQDYTEDNPITRRVPYHKYVYGSIESGYPAVVCFRLQDTSGAGAAHAVPIFGHTFNEDTWVPSAEFSYFKVGPRQYIPSESWVSTYIGHDDNWGSNFCFPRGYLRGMRYCDAVAGGPDVCPRETECVSYVIGTIPSDVKAEPLHAEIAGADYLPTLLSQLPDHEHFWADETKRHAQKGRVVLRPVLISMEQYMHHLSSIDDWDSNLIEKAFAKAFGRVRGGKHWWMIEYSLPELFPANRRKVGEIILRADRPLTAARDLGSILSARLPGCFAFVAGGTGNRPRFSFLRSRCVGHVPLFGC